jgi:hypothetical protein
MRLWYLRRAVPWTALLACLGLAVGCWLLARQWHSTALTMLPLMLASCAAAASFVFDDETTPIASVSARGATWRRTTRLLAVLLPVTSWVLLVGTVPDELDLVRPGWVFAGLAASALAVGLAGLAARRQVARPGQHIAGLVVVLALSPLVLGLFLGWRSVFPFGDFPQQATAFWAVVGGTGLVLTAVALRPGLR